MQSTPEVVQQGSDSMPRAKLTGQGRMPVADLRNGLNGQVTGLPPSGHCQANGGHPQVTGLPPKGPSGPVYAMVNKVNMLKKKLPSPKKSQPSHLHNYCNVSPLLGN